MDGATYVFFPLYPIALRNLDFVFNDILVTAFFLSNILLLLNFWGLIYILREFVKENTEIKTAFLLFLFPFSIFYRSYFSESLFLMILIWFSYFLVKKKYTYAGLLLGLLSLTRGAAVLLYPLLAYYIFQDVGNNKEKSTPIVSLALSLVPIGIWAFYNHIKTGNALYFMSVRTSWNGEHSIFSQLLSNINKVLDFSSMQIHSFHSSKVDIIIIASVLILLIFSLGTIKKEFWLIGTALFLAPLIFNDTMSFARYQIISFPLFLFLSQFLNNRLYYLVIVIFAIGLLTVSLLFVNWYWVG